jgi:hypothetical protein
VITFFTTAKPFKGMDCIHQCNALKSWKQLGQQVILMGNDEGVAEVAFELGFDHIPDIQRSEYNTPLISSLFALAEQHAKNDLLVYANADIIFTSDFLRAVKLVKDMNGPIMMTGRRTDIDFDGELTFDDGWEDRLKRIRGELYIVHGMDYFVYRKGTYPDIPATLTVARPAWDNWMLDTALSRMTVINATESVLAAHPRHGCSHEKGKDWVWEGPEAVINKELIGDRIYQAHTERIPWIIRNMELVQK